MCLCMTGYTFRHALRYRAESWHGGIRPRALAHIAQKVDIVRNKLIFSEEVLECVLNH